MKTQPSDAKARAGRSAGSGPTYLSFVVLAMIASVEAIFLATFVLISQNRIAAAADKRADLDLQISLLAEHEITRFVTLVSGIADRTGFRTVADADLEEVSLDVAPEAALDELEATDRTNG
jgi:uncharacterized membrane protein